MKFLSPVGLALQKLRSCLEKSSSPKLSGFTSAWAQQTGLARVSAGPGTHGHPRIIGLGEDELKIGKFVSIAENCTIILSNHDTEALSTYPFANIDWRQSKFRRIRPGDDPHAVTKGPTEIGDGVWLGWGSVVLPGVQIHEGAVVAACAVVTRDVPPYAVVAGNPARIVKYRFPADQITAVISADIYGLKAEEFLYRHGRQAE
jgi:acetyltransferase-like isoleucine patch superfamily enzyme